MMEIKLVTREEANQIFDTREPIGLFYEIDGDSYIGIDNSTGDAWVEDFKTKEECFRWLKQEPEPIDEREVYKGALDKWGAEPQITMVFEEMAELQKELCKDLRGKKVTGNIAEEIADVEIMLNQMKILYDIEDLVEFNKENKLRRLKDRIESED